MSQSKLVNFVSLAFMNFVMLILVFPSNPDPTARTMNYTVLVIGSWILLCLVYYYFPVYGGVHWFQGPVANVGATADKASDMESLSRAISVADI